MTNPKPKFPEIPEEETHSEKQTSIEFPRELNLNREAKRGAQCRLANTAENQEFGPAVPKAPGRG